MGCLAYLIELICSCRALELSASFAAVVTCVEEFAAAMSRMVADNFLHLENTFEQSFQKAFKLHGEYHLLFKLNYHT